MNVQLSSLSDLAWTQFWQVTTVVFCIAVLARLLGRTRPHLAYLLWLLVFVKCVTPRSGVVRKAFSVGSMPARLCRRPGQIAIPGRLLPC